MSACRPNFVEFDSELRGIGFVEGTIRSRDCLVVEIEIDGIVVVFVDGLSDFQGIFVELGFHNNRGES